MAGRWTWPWKTRSGFLVPWFVILSSRTLSQRQRKQRNCWQPYVVRVTLLVRLGALLLLLASFAADWSAGSGDCVTPFGRPLVCVNISRNLFPRALSYYSSQRARRTANLALPRLPWTIEDIREGSFDFLFAWKNKNKNTKRNKQTQTQFQWLESFSAFQGTFQLVIPSQFLLFPFLLKTLNTDLSTDLRTKEYGPKVPEP